MNLGLPERLIILAFPRVGRVFAVVTGILKSGPCRKISLFDPRCTLT